MSRPSPDVENLAFRALLNSVTHVSKKLFTLRAATPELPYPVYYPGVATPATPGSTPFTTPATPDYPATTPG